MYSIKDLEYPSHSPLIKDAFRQGADLLEGYKAVVAMGDLLSLASFSHIPVVSDLVVGCFTTQSEALEAVRVHRPNLLFVTEDLEQGYGIWLISEVERLYPETQCILFLKRETEPVVHEALEAGADGVVLVSSLGKGINGDPMKSLRQIAEGGTYYPQEVREAVASPTAELPPLTDREMDTLHALVGGMSHQEIAGKLFISVDTVKSHIRSLMQKTGCKDRTQVVIQAIRSGL